MDDFLHGIGAVLQHVQMRLDIALDLEVRILIIDLDQARGEALRLAAGAVTLLLGQLGVQGPVLFGDEVADLPLAVDDQPGGDALHAPGGEAVAHLLPQ